MKNEKLNKVVLPVVAGVLSLIGIILVMMFITMPDQDKMTVAEKEMYDGKIANALWYTMITVGIAIGAIFLFFLFGLVSNFKKAGKLLIGLIVFVVLFVVCYFIAGGEITEPMNKATNGDIDEGTVKMIEAGLYLTFLLAGLAAVLWVVWGTIARKLK